jgi:predicted transcriptional regulator
MTVQTTNWRKEQRARGDEYRRRLLIARVSQREIAAELDMNESVLSNNLAGVRKWAPGREEAFVKALEEAGA